MNSLNNLSEAEDEYLVSELVFKPVNLKLQKIQQGADKTPDFQVVDGESLVAYCELKSPQDDNWLGKLLDIAQPFEMVGGSRNDPTFSRIKKHAKKASIQFASINPDRVVPNILVYVNHDPNITFTDLMEVLTGIFHAENGHRYSSMFNISRSLTKAKMNLDLCVWIESQTKKIKGLTFNKEASPNYVERLCGLLNIDPQNIKW